MRRSRLGNTALGELVEINPTVIEEEQVDKIHISQFNAGLNLAEDPSKIADNEFTLLLANLRDNKLVPYVPFDSSILPTKPTATLINGIDSVLRYDDTIDVLRYTKSTVHKIELGAWVAVTGPALTGGDTDRFTTILIENRIFFNNHGVNVLMEVNTVANTYAAAGNARQYKYYVVANNRILGANLRGGSPQPLEVAGCGNLNYTEWDPAVDISAFRNVLVDAEETDSDEITGMVALKDNVILFRRRSIWIGVPQEIASAPFKWFKLFSGLGCTAEYSIRRCGDDTVIWLDPYTNNFYFWKLGMEAPEAIGDKIITKVMEDINNFNLTFSSWEPRDDVYEFYVQPRSEFLSGRTNIYRYHKKYKAWSASRFFTVTAVSNGVYPSATGTFDQLTGSFDDLPGTFDGLSESVNIPTILLGTNVGEIFVETNFGVDVFSPTVASFGNSVKSKEFTYHDSNIGILEVSIDIDVFKYSGQAASGLFLTLFRDRDVTETGEIFIPGDIGSKYLPITKAGKQTLTFRKHLSCKRFHLFFFGMGAFNTWYNVLGIRVKTVKEGAE